jgi:hypothetical protein
VTGTLNSLAVLKDFPTVQKTACMFVARRCSAGTIWGLCLPSPKGKELRLQALLVANPRQPVLSGSLDDCIAPETR